MMIFQGAPPPPRVSLAEAPLLYLAVAFCVVTMLVASLQVHLLLRDARRYRTDLARRARSVFAVGSWASVEYALDPANYQPGTAGPILRRVLKWMAVQGVSMLAAFAILLFFIL